MTMKAEEQFKGYINLFLNMFRKIRRNPLGIEELYAI